MRTLLVILLALALTGCASTRLSLVASTQIDGVDVAAVVSNR